MAKFTHMELIIAWKDFKLAKKIPTTWKKMYENQKIALEKFVFFTKKTLDIAQVA